MIPRVSKVGIYLYQIYYVGRGLYGVRVFKYKTRFRLGILVERVRSTLTRIDFQSNATNPHAHILLITVVPRFVASPGSRTREIDHFDNSSIIVVVYPSSFHARKYVMNCTYTFDTEHCALTDGEITITAAVDLCKKKKNCLKL